MKKALCCAVLMVVSVSALAQNNEVNRYTVFTGFDYVIGPARNLTERGFEVDTGITLKRWLGVGGDFSAVGSDVLSGAGTINGSDTSFAPALSAASALGAPPPSAVNVPFSSSTYIFAAGPQFYLRKWKKVTLFARPGFGGIHEVASLTLAPQVAGLFSILRVPVPAANQSDTTYFFGLGGGFDLNLSRRVGLRFATDWINTHLFSNLLTDRQNYTRFSVGPTFRWGYTSRL
jgi:opacity protein-like surface antigen